MPAKKKTTPAKPTSRGGLKPSLKAARSANKARARARGATRKQRIRVIVRLRKEGKSYKEIAHRLQLSPSTVRDYASDPTRKGAKRRQRNLRRRTVRARERGVTLVHRAPRRYARSPQHRAIIGAYATKRETGEWPK